MAGSSITAAATQSRAGSAVRRYGRVTYLVSTATVDMEGGE